CASSPPRAAYAASAPPALPAVGIATAFTPSSLARDTAADNPRALNDPVGLVPSSLRRTRRNPARLPRRGTGRSGVSPSPRETTGLGPPPGSSSPPPPRPPGAARPGPGAEGGARGRQSGGGREPLPACGRGGGGGGGALGAAAGAALQVAEGARAPRPLGRAPAAGRGARPARTSGAGA